MHRRFTTSREKLEKNVSEIISRHICLGIERDFDIFVAIPVMADREIFSTLESVSECDTFGKNVVVAVLLNESEDACENIKEENRKIFEELLRVSKRYERDNLMVEVRHIRSVPKNVAGVGFARRVLMDEAICSISKKCKRKDELYELLHRKFIFSLDSDSTVSKNYFSALDFVDLREADFGIMSFAHRFSEREDVKEAGIVWELFLRYWKNSLRVCGYKNAFYPIGSLFAFRALVYVVSMGMSVRKAGEDFYFLQKVMLFSDVVEVPGVYVFPKAEPSLRTPFGTGKEIHLFVSGNRDRIEKVWNFSSFEALEEIIQNIENPPDIFFDFLRENPKFQVQYERLEKLKLKDVELFRKKFFEWFNPFKVFKFLRFCERIYGRSFIDEEVRKLIMKMDEKGYIQSDELKKEKMNLIDTERKPEIYGSGMTESRVYRYEPLLAFLRKVDDYLSF
ncbi:hypothetical protein HRbin19_01223 [bacterium HR19]|nr:hypothetical protein HRbin19_01223 [bacterium HR19]